MAPSDDVYDAIVGNGFAPRQCSRCRAYLRAGDRVRVRSPNNGYSKTSIDCCMRCVRPDEPPLAGSFREAKTLSREELVAVVEEIQRLLYWHSSDEAWQFDRILSGGEDNDALVEGIDVIMRDAALRGFTNLDATPPEEPA